MADFASTILFDNHEFLLDTLFFRFALFLGEAFADFEALYNVFHTTQLDEFLQFTSFRLNLLHPATDGLESLRDSEDLIKYYYAIKNVDVVAG